MTAVPKPSFLPTGRGTQYVLASIGLVACLLGIWFSGRIGVTRMLATYGAASKTLPAVTEAVRLNPADPEVHYAHAQALQKSGQMAAAIPALEKAKNLQPRNYGLWLELGIAHDVTGKADAARTAIAQAVKLAPHYAQPHWQLGNLLLRAGRRAEAFAEFQTAINSDASFTPNAVDLAWGAFNGNAQTIEATLQPRTPVARLELARVFAMRGAVDEAMRLFRAVGDSTESTRKERDNLFAQLMKAKRYYEAWEVWAIGQGADATANRQGIGVINNGNFEQDINFAEAGFGWRINESKPTVTVARDRAAESASLYIRWEGKSYASVYIASQIVLVEPGKRYRLSFAARTKDLVSGGLPDISVLTDFEGQPLASVFLAQGSSDWKTFTTEFTAPPGKQFVVLAIRRKACATMPCPAFGAAWFDTFSLQTTS